MSILDIICLETKATKIELLLPTFSTECLGESGSFDQVDEGGGPEFLSQLWDLHPPGGGDGGDNTQS